MAKRLGAWSAVAVAAFSVLCALVTVALRIWGKGGDPGAALGGVARGAWAIDAIGACLWCVPGLLIARRRPDLRFGWLALSAAVGHGLAGVGLQVATTSVLGGRDWPGAAVGLWFAAWGSVVELPVLAAIYVLFPTGRLPLGWLRVAGIAAVTVVLAGFMSSVLLPFSYTLEARTPGPFAGLVNPITGDLDAGPASPIPLFAVGMLGACFTVLFRWCRARGDERRPLNGLALLAAAAPVVVIAVFALPSGVGFAVAELETFLEIAVVVSVVARHRLFGIEVALRRTVVYGALVTSLIGLHVVAVGITDALAPDADGSIVAAITVAIAVIPLRDRLQRLVTLLMYGERDDAFIVVSRISHAIRDAESPRHLLDTAVKSVAETLRLPYVAIDLLDTTPPMKVETGQRSGSEQAEFSLHHAGRILGRLIIIPRSGESRVSRADQLVLGDVAERLAVAVAAVAMTIDLQRSREQLVGVVEEERRRVRHDLHDGLGPILAASAYRLDTARALLPTDPLGADRLVGAARAELTTAIADIRAVVYGLRPPMLDELGLLGAIRHFVEASQDPQMSFTLDIPRQALVLSAAVEVAAYRIATEAVLNVRRHSMADQCTVRISCDPDLHLTVSDNGTAAAPWRAGVGLRSMRERAAQVGGICEAGPTGDGGLVSIRIPLEQGA
ncbi:sensor histidine kinase [Frankia tisae]|uniref:sensor histidine kinase n=1 Tax=Frankia tisae TaxID=2950104 RepID=UPI0021C22B80|nr:histidine kinase [Frankia tisae]